MNNLSFWEQQSFFHRYDVVVVGSGIVGLSAALSLKENDPGLQIAVVERGVLPFGASTRNAGFACFGSMSELLDDLSARPSEEVFALVERRWQGLQKLRQRLGDAQLHYQPFGGYEIFRAEEVAIFEKCMTRMPEFNRIIGEITGEKEVYVPADGKIKEFGFHGVSHIILNLAEGQIHTGSMMKSLIDLVRQSGIAIFNGLTIERLEEQTDRVALHTGPGWHFSAGKVLVATNGFARQLLPDLQLFPGRNQVLITKPLRDLPFRGSFHYDRGYFYFRNVDEPERTGWSRILLGGGRNLAMEEEKTAEFGTTELIRSALISLLKTVILPSHPVEIETWWSGIMGLGDEKKPVVKMVSPRIGVAVRLGGMGVALGSLVGEEAAEMLIAANS